MVRPPSPVGHGALLVAIIIGTATCAPAPAPSSLPTPQPAATALAAWPETPSPAPSPTPAETRVPAPTPPAVSLPTWTWTRGTLPQEGWRGPVSAIFPLSGAYVAVQTRYQPDDRRRAILLRSGDGLAWREAAFPVERLFYETGVVEDGVLTIVGSVGTATEPVRQLWQTRDGRRWTRIRGVRGLDFGPGQVSVLAHADHGWMALAIERIDAETAKSHLFRSRDLRTWEETAMPDGASDMGLATDGNRWLMAGPGFADTAFAFEVFVSDDGIAWSRHPVAALPRDDSAIALAGGAAGFVIGGQRFDPTDESSHPIGWHSPDGITWQPATFDSVPGPDGAARVDVVGVTGDGLVASGYGDRRQAAIWISDDGARWTQVTPLPGVWEGTVLRAVARTGDDLIVSGEESEDAPFTIWRGTTR